jgi:hypothetical protein
MSERLQRIAETILARIKPQCVDTDDSETTDCEYCNRAVLKLPNWYLRYRGHDLEDSVKEAFSSLKAFRRTNELQRAILTTVVDDTPDLLSLDFVSVFQKLQGLQISPPL